MAIDGVVALVLVHHAVVVTDRDLEGTYQEAETATQINVHTVEILTVVIADRIAAAYAGDVGIILHVGSKSILEGRATEQEDLRIAGKVNAVIQIHGDVDSVLGEGTGTGDDRADTGRFLGSDHGIVDTGSDGETAGKRNIEGDTGIGAVGIVRGVLGLQRGIEIARIDGHLGESLSAKQHQGCGQEGCKDLFHTQL